MALEPSAFQALSPEAMSARSGTLRGEGTKFATIRHNFLDRQVPDSEHEGDALSANLPLLANI